MKERLKELGYWLEGKIKDFCGELTPDKRITAIVIMLLILTIGNLYFTFSTIYNWGKESEKKKVLEIEQMMDSPVDKELFDLYQQKIRKDSIDSIRINQQKFKEYERTTENIFGAKAEA
ncbi:hypothetical protein M2451_001411 [Dysgonomonas sp. PFB1-18]|uniref:TraL conjugative transposon family protein n=1 Tax=unclassified Dysgonomonas TaxID=2630389 RepID=UPI00247326BD|nr:MULTISPECIES: TraL conjugative transposon family protein [unclassified Dysgonomonas]MDH6308845.1 hypothetical protein [Dysgonomonas sp. PF1-14]MDH6338459.1 hypothetical protein [Dysgonomonas sp. PF1-16]MDH6380094.1 hypothetical protein [Dysgonomonas sp. PFB1-18]MDH6397287.1 hypothetical protein [Dysgonomonas sp. PF1-23]